MDWMVFNDVVMVVAIMAASGKKATTDAFQNVL
jgi:hypothetical protein